MQIKKIVISCMRSALQRLIAFEPHQYTWTKPAVAWEPHLMHWSLGHNCHHHHQSVNCEGRWGTTDDFATSFFPFFLVLHCPLWLAELQACPFPYVVVPPLPLSALSSSPFHCALQDGFGQTWWMGDMTITLQFASFYDRQEFFMWSNFLLDLGTDFLIGNMVFVWDV